MKRKIFIFIGLITLILSFMLVKPQTKALVLGEDYQAMVVEWDDAYNVWITIFDGETTFTQSYDIAAVMDPITLDPILYGYEFQIGMKIEVDNLGVNTLSGVIVPEINEYLDETDLIDGFRYRYIKTLGGYHYFIRDMSFYKIPLSYISFNNTKSGLIEFITTTKEDNIYTFNDTLKAMYFYDSRDYQYELGGQLVAQDITDAYWQGKNDGYNEGLIDGYEDGKTEGLDDGYSNGYGDGFDDGFNTAIDSVNEDGIYQTGYNKGYDDGVKDKQEENTKSFYDGLQKWLVPGIITVIVLGGIFAFIRKKGEN